MAMVSKSRIMTASWARLAASAPSVKSFRKASVEGGLMLTGGGGRILLDDKGDDCDDGTAEEAAWDTGDEMGPSMVFLCIYLRRGREGERRRRGLAWNDKPCSCCKKHTGNPRETEKEEG